MYNIVQFDSTCQNYLVSAGRHDWPTVEAFSRYLQTILDMQKRTPKYPVIPAKPEMLVRLYPHVLGLYGAGGADDLGPQT